MRSRVARSSGSQLRSKGRNASAVREPLGLGLLLELWIVSQIEHRQIDADFRMHHLVGLAFVNGKGCAQALVAVDDCLQALLQCGYVE